MNADTHCVGINLPDSVQPAHIADNLRRFADAGFDCVEIPLDCLPMVLAGTLRRDMVRHLGSILGEFPLRYTAHIVGGLNLRSRDYFDIHEQTLTSCLEICDMLDIGMLTLHYEQRTLDDWVEERFHEVHVKAARRAAAYGLTLGIENIEVEHFDRVTEFVTRLNCDNVGITLDTGHLYLASQYFNYPLMEPVRQGASLIRHVHLNDNYGLFEPARLTDWALYRSMDIRERITLGRGDIHLPPGWGKVPFPSLLELLDGYRGAFICEYYNELYQPFLDDILGEVRDLLAGKEAG